MPALETFSRIERLVYVPGSVGFDWQPAANSYGVDPDMAVDWIEGLALEYDVPRDQFRYVAGRVFTQAELHDWLAREDDQGEPLTAEQFIGLLPN